MTTTGLSLEYIVLRCADLERSRAFYEALGLVLVPEQHGQGARHYSCAIGEIVLELYPLSAGSTSGVRLGFRVPDVAVAVEAATSVGGEVVRVASAGSSPSALLRDPDGHEVALRGLLQATDAALAAYEGEHGEITDAELAAVERKWPRG